MLSLINIKYYLLHIQFQADPNVDVRTRMINAGIRIIDKHGKENVLLLFPIFDSYLNKKVHTQLTINLHIYIYLL